MYFYILEGGTYDEYFKDIYFSETLYTQEEFEKIIMNAFKYFVEEIEFKNEYFHRCFTDFDPAYICWSDDFEKNEFIKWIEENSDLKIINKPVALMSIGTFSTPTKDTIKLKSGIDYSKMPQCRDNCVNEKDGVLGIKFNCTYPDRRYKAKLYSIRET